MTLIFGLVMLAISIWELIRTGQKLLKIGWDGWTNILMILLTKYNRPIDVSHLLIPPPPIAKENVEALIAIGFRRLGEVQIKYPFKKPLTAWIFINLENQIQASVAWKRVEFATYFHKKTLVVTDFPNGEHIETPDYQSHTIVTSISNAYSYHMQQVAKFSQKYGRYHPVCNMSDYLRWELIGRKNYGPRKLIRWALSNIVRFIAFTYGILALILTPLFLQKHSIPLPQIRLLSSQEIIIYLTILMVLPAIVVSQYFNRWTVQQTHQDSRNSRKS